MVEHGVTRSPVLVLVFLMVSLLSGCGGSSFTSDEEAPAEDVPLDDIVIPVRVPDAAQVPDCGDSILYDVGGSNGFGLQSVASGVSSPTDISFIPRSPSAFVVISQGGTVTYFNGRCTAINSIFLANDGNGGIGVNASGEQGLLNVAFHPDYANNGYIFFYHTTVTGQSNAISRLTVSFNSVGFMELSDPVRIITFRKNTGSTNHNGGGLVFAPDDTLLASVGDADGNNGQMNNNLLGVVVRIVPNLLPGMGGYSIPSGNLFSAENGKCSDAIDNLMPCPEILAMGLRNPFRMSIDGNSVFIGDVGTNNEEINSFSYKGSGANFGWPLHDGFVESSSIVNYRNPIVYYDRVDAIADAFRNEDPEGSASGSASIMVGDVYRGGQYANALNGKLLFADFYDGFVRAVGVDTNGGITDGDGVPGMHIKHQSFVSSMIEGEDGFIYITTYDNGGEVYRLVNP